MPGPGDQRRRSTALPDRWALCPTCPAQNAFLTHAILDSYTQSLLGCVALHPHILCSAAPFARFLPSW